LNRVAGSQDQDWHFLARLAKILENLQALFAGQKTPKAVMETVEAASQKVGARKFKVG